MNSRCSPAPPVPAEPELGSIRWHHLPQGHSGDIPSPGTPGRDSTRGAGCVLQEPSLCPFPLLFHTWGSLSAAVSCWGVTSPLPVLLCLSGHGENPILFIFYILYIIISHVIDISRLPPRSLVGFSPGHCLQGCRQLQPHLEASKIREGFQN